jgi:hypothetical protein
MDPLSLTTSIAGIATISLQHALQITNRLKTLWEGKSTALHSLQKEVEELSLIIEETQQKISSGELKQNLSLVQSLNDCSATLERTREVVEQATSKSKRKHFLSFNAKNSIQPLCQDLERLKLELTLLGSVAEKR